MGRQRKRLEKLLHQNLEKMFDQKYYHLLDQNLEKTFYQKGNHLLDQNLEQTFDQKGYDLLDQNLEKMVDEKKMVLELIDHSHNFVGGPLEHSEERSGSSSYLQTQ